MAADKSPFQKNRKPVTGHNTGTYAGYIRHLVADGKVCTIGTNMYVLSFINPIVWCSRSN